MSKIKITCGDLDFQKTLTEYERDYIHKGDNWISKLSREIHLKSIHSLGWTLDEVEALPEKEQDAFWKEANECWNNHDWSNAKFLKNNAEPIEPSDIVMTKK
jgi:hypothetical protein